MDAVISTITLGVIANFATDIIKWAAGTQNPPLDGAIQSTANLYPGLEGVEETLREWLKSEAVSRALRAFIEGEVGRDEFPILQLALMLVTDTGFYLPQHSDVTAEKIIATFLTKVRSTYLRNSSIGLLHLANRQDAGFDSMQQQLNRINASVESAGGLKPALQTHFHQGLARLEAGDYPAAKALFESLLTEFAEAPLRDRNLERRIHASLGQIAASLGDNDSAANHYKRAIEMDDDPTRASVNSAVVDLIEQKPDAALERLERVTGSEFSSVAFEYWAVKVEALLRLNRYPEAVATALSVQVDGKPGSRLELIGRANHASGNLEAAERSFRDALEIVPNKPEVEYSLATVLFAPAVDYRNQNPGAAIPREVTDKLSIAGNLLESASATFRSQGRDAAALDVESALALVRGLQDRHADSVRLLERIVRSSHATAHDWRNLGFSYLCINEPSKAVEALNISIAQDLDSMTELLYIQALTMSGKADDALAFIESRATGPITVDNVRWYVAKANVLSAKRQFSRAREVLTDVQRHSPTNAEVLLTIAEMYEATGNDAEAGPAYEEAFKNATGNDETRVRYMFGGFASRRKDFARAVELWKPLIRSDRSDTLLDSYLCALYNSGNLSEVTSISVEARKSQAKVSEVVADVAAAAYQRLEDLKESEFWLEYLCDTYGNKSRYIVRLSNIKFRLGRRDEATELLNASKSTLKNADELMGHAKAYSALGDHGDALELAHRAVLLESGPEIHMGYTGIFLAAGENVERTAEQISTFQDVLSKFNERFPDSLLLRSFKIDPDRPLDAIRDTLIKDSEQTRDAVKAYQNNQMPLYIFARLLGRDLYDVWFQIVSDPDLCLLTAAGTDDEQHEFQRLLSNAPGFIFDPVALFTFSFLGLIEELQILGDVYIAQSALDHLHELVAARALLQRQRGRMGIVDGQFFMHEYTTDELDKINSALNIATEWSETHAKTAGLKEPFTSEDTRWDEVLGSSNIATIVIAKQRGYVVVTDDKTLGDVGKHNYGTSFVNSQAVLLYLFNKGLIAKDAYDRAVLKLVEAGYVVTRIDGNQLFRVIVDEAFQVTPRLKRVLRVLEPVGIALPQACAAMAGILRLIYLEPIPEDMRNQLTFQILDTLATNHPKMDVQRLVRAFLRQQMTPLLVLQLGVIEQLLDRW